jgi:RNA polymerase sigma-70 factor (ECF subfamily)
MGEFDQVMAAFGPALARVAAGYERDPALRADLAQEIAIAVWRALPRLQDPARLRAYVFRIAHNRAVSHVISRAREPDLAGDAALEPLACDGPGPERALIVKERSERLMTAVRALPLAQRQPLILALEGLSYAEIGEALGISETLAGVRISRARQRLKAEFDDER